MSRNNRDDDWDFTSVIDLIHSLSSKADPCSTSDTSLGFSSEEPRTPEQGEEDGGDQRGLGNFDKLWKYLGQPLDVPSPAFVSDPHDRLGEAADLDVKSVDALFDLSVSKGVRWRDEVEGADLADNDEKYDPTSLPQLSKARKKKLRQKKIADAKKAQSRSPSSLAPTSSENESELDTHKPARSRSRGSVIREILDGSRPEINTPGVDVNPTPEGGDQDGEAPKWPIANPRYFLRSSVRTSETTTQKPDGSLSIVALRKSTLITKLRERFIEDRPYLENIGLIPGSATNNLQIDSGVHVFVDASNVS